MRLRRASLLSCLLAFAGCTPDIYRADVGAMFTGGDGRLGLQNGAGSLVLHDHQNEFDRDLGLGGTEASPYVRIEWERDRHHVRAHGFGFDATGSGTLEGNFGDILAGSSVETSMDFWAVSASYAYELLGGEYWRLGLGAHLGYYGLDVDARSGIVSESVRTDLLAPLPYAEAEVRLGPVSLGGNLGVMALDAGDATGRWIDAEAIVRWNVTRKVDLLAGYRLLVLDGYGRASSRDFDADIDFDGFFVGGGVRF